MLLGHVVDQFHDHNGLAHAGAAEQSDLSALEKWLDQVDDLHAGLKHLRLGRLLVKRRRRAMDGQPLGRLDRAKLVHRLADHVHHAAQRLFAHRHRDRPAQVERLHAPHHAVRGLHRDGAHAAFAQMLLHFQHHVDRIGTLKPSLVTRNAW